MKIALSFLLALLPFAATAQPTCASPPADPVPSWQVRWSWTAPTQNTDGSAIKPPITYTVYEGSTAICTTSSTAAGWSPTPGAHSWGVTAKTAANGESAQSNMASKTIVVAPPKPPTNLQVDPASLTAWVLAPTTNKVSLLAVGTLTPGTQCDPTQPVLDKFVVLVDAAHPVLKPPTSTNRSVVYLGTCG